MTSTDHPPPAEPGTAAALAAAHPAAVAVLAKILADLKAEAEPAPDWPEKVKAFLAARAHLAPGSLVLYRHHLARAVKHLGHPPDPAAIVASCEPKWTDGSRRNYLMMVETFLRWCGYKVTMPKPGMPSAGSKRLIPEEVYQKALGAAGPGLKPLLRFLWNTGCRPSEAYTLTAADVSWDTGTITLKKHKTKRHGKQRIIYLSPAALAVLTAQKEKHPTGPLFPTGAGTQWKPKTLSRAMWRLAKRIGKKVCAYGCRHTYCTRALEKGLPDTHVAALLGHSSTEMIHKHYSHLSENARLLKDAAAKV